MKLFTAGSLSRVLAFPLTALAVSGVALAADPQPAGEGRAEAITSPANAFVSNASPGTLYSVAPVTLDSGGAHARSAIYTSDGSLTSLAGIPSVTAPAETARNGYVGQLYELTNTLTLRAASTTIAETATLPLTVYQTLDDGTRLAVPPANVAWSVAAGPLASIRADGVALAQVVYQDTAATAQAVYLSQTLTLGLTVLNTLPDNYGSYADDGIDDSWQIQYFGLPPNAAAGPTVDADHSGQTNFFKYIAGLNPLDPNSRFTLTIAPVPGQPGQQQLIFGPVVAGRFYLVTARSNLSGGTWIPITSSAPQDNGTQRTIIDLGASGTTKFYRVEITR